MREEVGNIWDLINFGHIVIPTNGYVKSNGKAVMGRGLAQQATQKYRNIDVRLGAAIKAHGNHVHEFMSDWLFTFPVKHNWWERADIELICRSCEELRHKIDGRDIPMLIPRVGCGNGQLQWSEVRPIIETYFRQDERITIVDLRGD